MIPGRCRPCKHHTRANPGSEDPGREKDRPAATNGRDDGYVKRADLEAADGTAAAEHFKSPEGSLRWQEENEGKTVSLPVYEEDGRTAIGTFVVGAG